MRGLRPCFTDLTPRVPLRIHSLALWKRVAPSVGFLYNALSLVGRWNVFGETAWKEGERMKDCMDLELLHSRIHKVIGQCNGIDGMIERDVPCEDILLQVSAAKSALHKVGQMILEGHLRHCVREGIEKGNADETIAKFAQSVEYFCRMRK